MSRPGETAAAAALVECAVCDGTGWVETDGCDGRGEHRSEAVRCSVCLGFGEVARDDEDEDDGLEGGLGAEVVWEAPL